MEPLFVVAATREPAAKKRPPAANEHREPLFIHVATAAPAAKKLPGTSIEGRSANAVAV